MRVRCLHVRVVRGVCMSGLSGVFACQGCQGCLHVRVVRGVCTSGLSGVFACQGAPLSDRWLNVHVRAFSCVGYPSSGCVQVCTLREPTIRSGQS